MAQPELKQMAYVALYRKYRSQNFEELMGQDSVTTTLQNAIRTGRIAQAYLFHGARGCGKTSTARLLSRALNCVVQDGPTPTPCGKCALCVSIREGTCMDVVEIDAASETGVDNVREKIIENVQYASSEARYKVYIIDEVHDLSSKAFDALLKTIEEPPAHVVFVLATTEFQKVPITIRSRCQCYQFKRGSIQDLSKAVERVVRAEGFTAAPEAIQAVARSAEGSWRDALSILEQVLAYSDGHVSADTVHRALGTVGTEMLARVTATLAEGAWNSTLDIAAELVDSGTDVRQLMTALGSHLRDLMLLATGARQAAAQELGPDRLAMLQAQTRLFSPAMLLDMMAELSAGERELRFSNQHRVILERTLCRLMMIGQGTYGSAAQGTGAVAGLGVAPATTVGRTRNEVRPDIHTTPSIQEQPVDQAVAPSPPPPRSASSLTGSTTSESNTRSGFITDASADEDATDTENSESPTTDNNTASFSPQPEVNRGTPPTSSGTSPAGIDSNRHQFAEEITLEVVRRSWERIANQVRKVSPMGAGYFEKAHVSALTSKTIVLIFTDSFARDRIQAKIAFFEKKINEYFKTTGYRLQCLMESPAGNGPTVSNGSLPPAKNRVENVTGTEATFPSDETGTLLDTPIVQPNRNTPSRIMDFEIPSAMPPPKTFYEPNTNSTNLQSPRTVQHEPNTNSTNLQSPRTVQHEPNTNSTNPQSPRTVQHEPNMNSTNPQSPRTVQHDNGSNVTGIHSAHNGTGNSGHPSSVNGTGNSAQPPGVNGTGTPQQPSPPQEPDPDDGMLEEVLRIFGGDLIDPE